MEVLESPGKVLDYFVSKTVGTVYFRPINSNTPMNIQLSLRRPISLLPPLGGIVITPVCWMVIGLFVSLVAISRNSDYNKILKVVPAISHRIYAVARPSVCLSHGWISQKRLKLGSCNFHHTVAPPL